MATGVHQITEAMVERMARALFARTTEGRNGFSWPLNGDWGRQRDLDDARRALVRVLGADEEASPLEAMSHDWDCVHDRPADIYTPPEDRVVRPPSESTPVLDSQRGDV